MSIEMRAVLCNALKERMAKDKRIIVIDADLAKANGTHSLRKDFPDRALDVGIQEANMQSIAAGLSTYGFIPFTTTFAPFATRRALDQIMLSCAYAKQNVRIIGSDPGISAELNGGTHMGNEDVAALRAIPDICIFEPVDAIQFEKAFDQIVEYKGVMYIRMFRKAIDDVFDENYKFDLFKADTLKEGKDISIFASGIMVQESIKALELLKEKGIDAELINIHTIKPIDKEAVLKSAKKTGHVLVCENHNVIGGLGSAVAEILSENYPVKMARIGVQDKFGEVGKLPYLKEVYKMRDVDIVEKAIELLK